MLGQKILEREKYLTSGYEPEELPEREQEKEKIVRTVKRSSESLFLHGPTGSGKTITVKNALQEIEDSSTFTASYVNCHEYKTKTAIYTRTLNYTGRTELLALRKGKPVDVLYKKLKHFSEKENFVLALDSLNRETVRSGVLRSLSELPLTLVLVSNDAKVLEEADEGTFTRIFPKVVEFKPYGREKLVAILERRCDKALKTGAVSEEAIPEVVEKVTQNRGDVNVALNLLKSSVRLAERENSEVTEGHVAKSYENLKNILGDVDEED